MNRDIICGLDIGTFKICLSCGRVEPSGRIDVLANLALPAQGMDAGRIADSKKLSASVREAMDRLRKLSGLKVRRVYANIDSPDLRVKLCKGEFCFGQKTELKQFHLQQLIDSCISANIPLDRKVIQIGFKNFRLDDKEDSAFPEGRYAYKVNLEIAAISLPIPIIKKFCSCIRDAGLILEDAAPSGCAQAWSLFKNCQPEIKKTVILIDIGAGLIKILLLEDNLAKDIIILPQGARTITEDIAAKIKLSFDCAEQLKLNYGRADYTMGNSTQKIIINDKHTNRIIQPQDLYKIIALRVDCLLQEIKKALLKLNYEREKISEIIITGGGSIMEGFLEKAEEILAKPVKMGFLSGVKDSLIQTQSGLYATSIGLIQLGSNSKLQKNSWARLRFNPFSYILKQTRQLHQEYF